MIFNITNGSGGAGGVLTVTAPVGVTVTVSKDDKVKTKPTDTNGVAVFKGLESGTWSIVITDGALTASQVVEIDNEYSLSMDFFTATITVTYPAGSTCTCSDGNSTLTATSTSGTYTFTVHNTGTWTVSCTDGTDSDSEEVVITDDGQSESIELKYWNGELYDSGNEYAGWSYAPLRYNAVAAVAPTVTRNATSIMITSANEVGGAFVYNEAIDVTGFSTLTLDGTLTTAYAAYPQLASLNVWRELGDTIDDDLIARVGYNSASVHTIDLTEVTGFVRIGLFVWGMNGAITMNRLKLS